MLETKAKIKLLQPSHRAQKLCHSSGWSCPMWRPALFILITSSCRRTSTCCTLPAQPRLLDTAVLQAVGSKAMSPAPGRLAAGYSLCLFWGIISGILLCTPGALCRGNTRHTTSGFVSLEASGQLSSLLLDFFILWKNVLSSIFLFFFFFPTQKKLLKYLDSYQVKAFRILNTLTSSFVPAHVCSTCTATNQFNKPTTCKDLPTDLNEYSLKLGKHIETRWTSLM